MGVTAQEAWPCFSLKARASGGRQQTHHESKGSEINSQYHLQVEGPAPHKKLLMQFGFK